MSSIDLSAIFEDAHTINQFDGRPVSAETLSAIYQRLRFAPTAMNVSPLRLVYVQSAEAKAKLQPCLAPGNVDKTMAAPVTAIAAWDSRFFEHMDTLVPHMPGASERFSGNAVAAEKTGVFSATLQIGYFILAARAHNLGVGPMAGFDAAAVDAAFFADGRFRSLLLLNLGYPAADGFRARAPRLDAAEVMQIV